MGTPQFEKAGQYDHLPVGPGQIRWFKNVTRNKGSEVAYEDVLTRKAPVLNWPTSKGKTNPSRPHKGDIVLVFQRPKKVGGGKTIMSHLFQILDEVPFEDPEFKKHKWARRIEVIAVNDLSNPFPKPEEFNFGAAGNSGVACDITKLANVAGLTVKQTQQKIWECFGLSSGGLVSSDTTDYNDLEPLSTLQRTYQEGERLRVHIQTERALRNSDAVRDKINEGFRFGNGRLLCECCRFDFFEEYGLIGQGFVECHHKNFISNGERKTTLEDLALVCSNCHRMLHRRKDDGTYLKVSELTEYFSSKIPY